MAKVLHGAMVADIRGKLGGSVFQRGPSGSVLHTLSRPRRSAGIVPTVQRTIFSHLSTAWTRDLSEAERRSWRGFALAHPVATRSGRVQSLSAQQMFLRTAYWVFWWDLTLLTSPPANLDVGNLNWVSPLLDRSSQLVSLYFSPSPVPADHFIAYWPSGPFSRGRLNNVSRVIGGAAWLDPAATSPTTVSSIWIARYGAIPATGRVTFSARLVNYTNGAFTPLVSTSENIQP